VVAAPKPSPPTATTGVAAPSPVGKSSASIACGPSNCEATRRRASPRETTVLPASVKSCLKATKT
jgi:hypothetical protein